MKQLLIFLSIVYVFTGCTSNNDCENIVDLNNVKSPVPFVRLDKQLFDAKSPEDVKQVLVKYPLAAKKLFGIDPQDSIAVSDLFGFYTQEGLREFYLQGEKINNDFSKLDESVTNMFKHIKYYFPHYHIPEIYTVVTGLPQQRPGEAIPDVIASDSIVSVGIDYFYGKKSKHRPLEYNYMLQRREPFYIVPAVALRIAQEEFVEYDANDKTLLSEMIKWGKAHYFMKRTMPCTPDSIIIGYTSQQMKDVENNMDIIWGYFIEHKLFYESKTEEVNRYAGESPKVAVIGEKCPGRIGRYLGWQIVKGYMDKNPKVTLEQLMKEVDAQKIFKLSKYKPKPK